MSKFAQKMSFYTSYHQERRNIAIHIVGVPMISFSILVLMSWVELINFQGTSVSLATVFTIATLLYYFSLDFIFFILSSLFFGSLLILAHWVGSMGTAVGWAVFIASQTIGWGTQIYGHYVFEKKKPAFLDNVFQALFSAPIFVIADVCFLLGFRKGLQKEVETMVKKKLQVKNA